jgi:hypothetical protein
VQTLRRPEVRDQAAQQIKRYIVDHRAAGRVDAATAEIARAH